MKVAKELTDFEQRTEVYRDHLNLIQKHLDSAKKSKNPSHGSNGNTNTSLLTARRDSLAKLWRSFEESYESLLLTTTDVTADNLHDLGYHDWMRLTKEDLEYINNEEDQKNYEELVKSYLTNFEQTVNRFHNNPPKKYTIYFDWQKTNKEHPLIIYIKADVGLDGTYYFDYEHTGKGIKNKPGSGKNGAGSPEKGQKSPFPPPPSTKTDPQQPPPPPKGKR